MAGRPFLTGRVALVTGGVRGIGRAIAVRLAAEGAAVAVNYRSSATDAASTVEEIDAGGGKAVALQADVADYASARQLVDRTLEHLGGLHILVNNAGIARDRLLMEMEPDDWLEVMRVNFGGTFNCTRAAADVFALQGEGSIVNIASITATRVRVGQSNYAASKAAILAFTRSCAVELGPHGIRVNAVLPSYVATELVGGADTDEARQLKRISPLRRLTSAEDVANTVAYLVGPEAQGISGAEIPVDGASSIPLGPPPRRPA